MRVIFTGPPGSGKSSVFNHFEKDYFYSTSPEVAREWIDWFKKHEPYNLPWNNREYFQSLIETHQIKAWIKNGDSKKVPLIFDRGLPDEVGYRKFLGMECPQRLLDNCQKYRYDKVFYFPFWEEIYTQDETRIETVEQAEEIDMLLREGYAACGYELIEVPKESITERIVFIINNL